MTRDGSRPALWFAEEWTTALANVMEALAGERPQLNCAPPSDDSTLGDPSFHQQHGDTFWWRQPLVLPGDPIVWVGAPQESWKELAERVLGTGDGIDDAQIRETYLEILQQSFGELARSATKRWGQQVDPGAGSEVGEPSSTRDFYQVHAVYSDGKTAGLFITITGEPQDPRPEEPAAGTVETEGDSPGIARSAVQSKTFDLLLGVELPVCVSFGHIQLPLKDVLKLTAGSIIELNRTVDEPVEVIVNNCVVARGEVVVVEGNYGVRIHHIMSRKERLDALP
ncbi:MAG: FliM/FliN family flagellar motor switch protein [Bryobacteraceae bacterium]